MKTVYRANDGTVWENTNDCIAHEEEIKKKEEVEKDKKERIKEIDEMLDKVNHMIMQFNKDYNCKLDNYDIFESYPEIWRWFFV